MTAQQFRDKLLHNWQAKVVCLVTAILLYFFHELSIVDKKSFTVPVTVTANGLMVPSSSLSSKYVKITVRGKSDALSAITESDVAAYVDITGETKEGELTLPVLIQPDSRLLLMDSLEITCNPEKVSLKVEEKTTKYVSVNPVVSGEAAHGYEIASITVNPSTVKITGPKTMVSSMHSVNTAKVDVEGISGNTVRDVSLVNTNSLIQLDDSGFKTKVSVVVTPSGMSKTLEGVKVSFRNVPENIVLSESTVETSVVLEGQVLQLENVTPSQVIAWVDCSGITETGSYVLPVRIVVPEGTSLINLQLENLTVSAQLISEEPEFGEEPVSDAEMESQEENSEAGDSENKAEEGSAETENDRPSGADVQ